MLEISRPDIEREFIQEFPADQRFIKLPIINYLKLLGAWEEVNRPQIALINAVNNPKYRFISAAYSRRVGKTYVANIIGQLVFLIPNCNVLIISPNYSLSSISFELQRKFIRHFELELERDNTKDRVLELPNGSTIRMGSVGQVDSCVGRSYDLIIFDEAALGKDGEAAFNVALRPTLDKPNAKAIFISTPRGKKNWFSKFFHRGYSDEFPEWVSLHADYTENTRMSERDVKEARASMSKAEFEQEYMASFVTYEGQIYSFNNENVIDYLPQDSYEVIAGIDAGYRDPTAMIVMLYVYSEDKFYVVDEYIAQETNTKVHAERITELMEKWNIESIFIDSAAAQFAADLAYIYNIPTIKAKKSVLDGIAYCQTIVDTDRLMVHSNCTNVLDALDQYQWDTNESLQKERPMHNQASHMMDAMRYALYSYTI